MHSEDAQQTARPLESARDKKEVQIIGFPYYILEFRCVIFPMSAYNRATKPPLKETTKQNALKESMSHHKIKIPRRGNVIKSLMLAHIALVEKLLSDATQEYIFTLYMVFVE